MFLTFLACGEGNGCKADMKTSSFGFYYMNNINTFAPFVLFFIQERNINRFYDLLGRYIKQFIQKQNCEWALGPTGEFLKSTIIGLCVRPIALKKLCCGCGC